MKETYSFEEALEKSLEWCNRNKGWKRMCDIEDTDALNVTWSELPESVRREWLEENEEEEIAEKMWKEFGSTPCKVPYGFVTGKGEFYRNIREVPLYHNLMTVFKVDELKKSK